MPTAVLRLERKPHNDVPISARRKSSLPFLVPPAPTEGPSDDRLPIFGGHHTHTPRTAARASIATIDSEREQVDVLLKRVASLSTGLNAVSIRWDDQQAQFDTLIGSSASTVFPADEQERLGPAAHELILAAAASSTEGRTALAQAAEDVRSQVRRHSNIGIEPSASSSGICLLEPNSMRHYPKHQANDNHFHSALARALMPLPSFFKLARARNGSKLPSLPTKPARSRTIAPGAGGAQAAFPAEQSFDAFAANAYKISPKGLILVVSIGRVSRDVAFMVHGTATAMCGLHTVTAELCPMPKHVPVSAGTKHHLSNHITEDLLVAAEEATERAQRRLGSVQHIVATLALVHAPLDADASRRSSGKTILISTLPTAAAPPPPDTDAAPPAAPPPPENSGAPTSTATAAKATRQAAIALAMSRTQQALAHQLGIEACHTHRCALAAKEYNTCPHLCPLCLRKVLWATPATLEQYYTAQRDLFASGGAQRHKAEQRWLNERMAFLFGRPQQAHARLAPRGSASLSQLQRLQDTHRRFSL
jgi:hypothetical protein